MTRSRNPLFVNLLIAGALVGCGLLRPTPVSATPAGPGIAGAVRSHDGSPVVGSSVGLIDHGTGGLTALSTTSVAGEFRFDSVRPGRYRVAVGVRDGAFASASYVASVATPGSQDARVDWTLYPAGSPAPSPRTLTAQSSGVVGGVVSHPETTTPLATPAFVADVPVWVLAAGAAGGAAGITLGSLCLTGTAICEEDKPAASPER